MPTPMVLKPPTREEKRTNVGAAYTTIKRLAKLKPQPGEKFLDIGANICHVSNYMASLGLRCRAYEPLPMAVAAAHPAPNVEFIPKAVTADGRNVQMVLSKKAVSEGYFCSARVVLNGRTDSSEQTFLDIESVPIQEAIDSFGADIIKIDTEGSEYELLPVADLSSARALFIEFHGLNNPRRVAMLPLVILRLLKQGFTPTNGWTTNLHLDPREARPQLLGGGFWREVLFEKGDAEPQGVRSVLEQLQALGHKSESETETRLWKEVFQ